MTQTEARTLLTQNIKKYLRLLTGLVVYHENIVFKLRYHLQNFLLDYFYVIWKEEKTNSVVSVSILVRIHVLVIQPQKEGLQGIGQRRGESDVEESFTPRRDAAGDRWVH